MLKWARSRAGLKVEELAEAIKVDEGKLRAWEFGSTRPTFEQARRASVAMRVPLGFLFFPRPPEETDPLPDLRTVGDRAAPPSSDLRDVVRLARRRQDWLRAHRRREGWESVSLVGACGREDSPTEISECLRSCLGVTAATRASVSSWDEYMRALVGLVRGFALLDDLAPLIFVNTKDAPPARIFTLVHELAHLALGIGGVSNAALADPRAAPLPEEEKLCNSIAAEFLVPADEFRVLWDGSLGLLQNTTALSRHFRVSQLVVARRALDLGLVPPQVFWPFATERLQLAAAKRTKQADGPGGPPPLVLARSRNGRRFTQLVVGAARAGELLYRDAAEILGVKPRHIDELAEAV